MLIGIDASRANRKFKSGTEWYSYHLIRQLAKLDQKNNYILYSDEPLVGGLTDLTIAEEKIKPTESKVNHRGWQTITSPHLNFSAKILTWPFSFFWTQARLSLEMIFARPDVLFIPAHTLPYVHPKRSVMTIHDLGFIRSKQLYQTESLGPENKFSRGLINRLVKLLTVNKYSANTLDYLNWSTRFGLKHAKKVITVSHFSKEEIKKIYGVSDEKLQVIYNGCNVELYKKIDRPDRVKAVLDKYGISQPFIFYVGRLEKKKNIPDLVNAYAIMREKYKKIKHRLVLVGQASHGFDEVNYVIQEFNLNQEVIITGWIPEEDLPYIYNGASAFIFPSLYEGFGIPLIQAMACATPVAASRAGSIPEVAGDAALYFDPESKSDMAEKMAQIVTDDNLRNELVKKGLDRVKNFSWEKCTKETLAVLESL